MKLAFHPEAERELDEAVSYYEDCRVGLGEEFMQEIYATIERMLAYPKAWPVLESPVRRVLTHRFPYGLLYVETAEQVTIVAVMNLHRSPSYWKDRK